MGPPSVRESINDPQPAQETLPCVPNFYGCAYNYHSVSQYRHYMALVHTNIYMGFNKKEVKLGISFSK
jgi:hypothetical protein